MEKNRETSARATQTAIISDIENPIKGIIQ
jgi:hypothetical protein